MEAVSIRLTYPGGDRYTLSGPLTASVTRALESPAQSLAVTFPLEQGSLPGAAVAIQLLRGGRVLFDGLCDQQTAREDQDGRTLTIQARSRGGLLLDNEALPQTYYNITTSQLFRDCLGPWGFSRLLVPREVELGLFTVPKGRSVWEVFSAFCVRAYARPPVVGEGDRVTVEEPSRQPAAPISNRPGSGGLRYLSAEDTLRRASVVSELLLRDRQGNYSRRVENPFGNPWEVRRRRYLIPAAEFATAPLSDGYQQFREAQRGAHAAQVVLPGWGDLWPGDCVRLDTGLGDQGSMTGWRVRWDRSPRGEYTTLTLTPTGLS